MRLTETCIRVRVGKHFSDMFPIQNGLKQGDALSPLLLDVALDYAVKWFQVNQKALKVNGKGQLLVYADDVYILSGNVVHTIKKNSDAVVVANNVNGVKVNADKIKCSMMMSGDQNAG